MKRALPLVLLLGVAGCDAGSPAPGVGMDFSRAGGFYDAPFPSEDLRGEAGVSVAGFPNPRRVDFVTQVVALVEGADGFATTSGVFFRLDAPPDASPPDVYASLEPGAPVFLMDVEPGSPGYLERHPIDVRYEEDGGPHGVAHQLSLLPLQGVPLRPRALHAAVVLRSLGAHGSALRAMPAIDDLELPPAAAADYRAALASLSDAGIAADELAGLAVFRTWDPVAGMVAARRTILERARPVVPALSPIETHDGFCVFEARIEVPVYQTGEPPYEREGGGWAVDPDGGLVEQATATSRVFVTLPRAPMPDGGYPVVLFVRTGGGGDRPLIDRGVRDASGEPVEAGSGPARELARAGFAGITWDGPHGGLRNPSGADEQALIFNILNAAALRDNVRQSALEAVLLAHLVDDVRVDASACEEVGVAEARLDPGAIAIFGHSMGATIAPLAVAVEPRLELVLLSGAGGSWLENLVHKRKPVPVRVFAETLLGYRGRALHEHDPVVSLLQWVGEPADPPIFGGAIDRHVLMMQGIVDEYILPPIANATSLSLGLDLVGPSVEAGHPELAEFRTLESLLPLVGGRREDAPVAGNRGARTAAVVQHAEDGVEDGHEVAFQLEAPKRQYRCFLETWRAAGVPRVTAGATDACD